MEICVHSISHNYNNGFVTLNENEEGCEAIVKYKRRDKSCYIDSIEKMDNVTQEEIDKLIKAAFEDISEYRFIPVPECKEAREWYEKEKSRMEKPERLIDVEPNGADGSKDLNISEDLYDLFIEYPVRKACHDLNDLGFKTIMSSANKNDAMSAGEPDKVNKVGIIGPNEHFSIGNGYTWIMIDFESISEENKRIIEALRNGEIPIELNDDAKSRLEKNCMVNDIPPSQNELVKYYRCITSDQRGFFFESMYTNRKLPDYFKDNCTTLRNKNSLSFHGGDFGSVVFKYPIDENTKSSEVIEYYDRVLSYLKDNKKRITINSGMGNGGTM